MAKSQHRLALDTVEGISRLASIRLSKHGDLFIAIRTGQKHRDVELLRSQGGSKYHNREIQELRFTIHPVRNNLNRINSHYALRGELKQTVAMTTDSIVKHDRFVFLCSRYGSEPPPANYGSGALNHIIGRFDPDAFTVHWSLLVSHPDVAMKDTGSRINMHSIVLGGFRITVLWSFIPLLSPMAAATLMPNLQQSTANALGRTVTVDATEAEDLHSIINREFFENILNLQLSTMVFPSLLDSLIFRRVLGHYGMLRSGLKGSLEYKMFRASAPKLPKRQFHIGVFDV